MSSRPRPPSPHHKSINRAVWHLGKNKMADQMKGAHHPWRCLSARLWMPSRPAFRVGKDHCPDRITHMSQSIGYTETEAVDRVRVHLQWDIPERGSRLQPLVELNAVLHPTVVKLQNRPARCDLEEPGTAHLAFPESSAPLANIATAGDPRPSPRG